MNKNTFNLIGFVAVIAFMLFTFVLDKQSENQQAPNTAPSGQSKASPKKSSGLIPTGPWPAVDNDSVIAVAEDPLATNYYVILDASGSMNRGVNGVRKMDSAKKAITQFAKSLPEGANIGLSTFSPAKEVIPLGTNNRDGFIIAVNKLQPKGGTPLVQSIKRGFESLSKQARNQSGYGRYILLIVTDGKSSDGDPSQIARDIVRHSAIEVQTIGFGVQNHALNLKGITEYYTANSVEALVDALNNVLASETEAFVDPTSFNN